jgi:hypothetical protein
MAISNQPSEQNALPLVKPDPTGKTSKNNMILFTILDLFWFGSALLYFFVYIRRGTGVPILFWFYLFIGVLHLALVFLLRRQTQAWKRHEQRRQLAAQGNREQGTLATEQPIPNASALPLSTILRAKNRVSTNLFIFGLLYVVIAMLMIAGEFAFTATQSHSAPIYVSTATLLINAIILLLLLFLAGIGAIFTSRQTTQQLEFTETGLLKRTGKKVIVMPWDEARLFAIIPASPAVKKTSGPPTTYELSSANEVLRWSASERMALFVGQAAVTSDEYRRQMQALLSVITARTDLPLYDLRGHFITHRSPKDELKHV